MTDVDICNLALASLGDSATVTSINPPEGSAQAKHCARFYPMAVSMMLEMHQWNFITKRVLLALVASPYFDGRWQFAYQYPSDANDLISVLPQACYSGCADGWLWSGWDGWNGSPLEFEAGYAKDFQVEMSGTTQVILSNVCDAVGRYTSTQAQSAQFPALFTQALQWLLASMLAGPLIKGDAGMKMAASCLQTSRGIAGEAMAQDANQKRESKQNIPTWIARR